MVEKLLGAFGAEYPSLVEAMRVAVQKHREGRLPIGEVWSEAFRAAHSLKGAARICELKKLEGIGGSLESLFAKIKDGELVPEERELEFLESTFDSVEIAASIAVENGTESDEAFDISAVEKIGNWHEVKPAESEPEPKLELNDLQRRLLSAFEIENAEHLEEIRNLLESVDDDPSRLTAENISEIFRRAHSIKGAARVNDLDNIENVAHLLESLFERVRDGAYQLNKSTIRTISEVLDVMEDAAEVAIHGGAVVDTSAVIKRLEEELQTPSMGREEEVEASTEKSSAVAGPPPAGEEVDDLEKPVASLSVSESVRVSTKALDQLLETAGQLSAHSFQQESEDIKLAALAEQVLGLQKAIESLRKRDVADSINDLSTVSHDLRDISRQLRGMHLSQQASQWNLSRLAGQLREDTRKARFIPASSLYQGFRKMMRDQAADEGKSISVRMSGLEVEADRVVLQTLKDPLMHVLGNAVNHGLETPDERRRAGKDEVGKVELKIESVGNRLVLQIEDDGAGIDYRRIQEIAIKRELLTSSEANSANEEQLAALLFHPHFSTAKKITSHSGRGVGMSVVSEAAKKLHGEATISDRADGPGTIVKVSVPLSLASQRVVMVTFQGKEYGIPLTGVDQLIRIPWNDTSMLEGQRRVEIDDKSIPLLTLGQMLKTEDSGIALENEEVSLVILTAGGRTMAVAVDEFVGVRDAIVRDLPAPAAVNPLLSGAILNERGAVTLVLNPSELTAALSESFRPAKAINPDDISNDNGEPNKDGRQTILVVDDSFTTRTLEKSVLEAHGYHVLIAVDGLDGLQRLRANHADIDLAIIDAEMPRMDGFTLLGEIKKDPTLKVKPVIMCTSLETPAHIKRGLDLGAEAYIVKRKFNHEELLEIVEQNI